MRASDLPEQFFAYGPVGVARADRVEDSAWQAFCEWRAAGKAAGMDYLSRYDELRRDPRLLLPGAKSILTFAFSYQSTRHREPNLPRISEYALGDDYHDVIRQHLKQLIALLPSEYQYRICVDSAPVMERYWAARSGLGYLCDNGMIAVLGIGSRVFLAEIITDLEIEPTKPLGNKCAECGRCRRACPAGALQDNKTIDCWRCLSYLTIEHRGDWTNRDALEAMSTPAGRNTIYGCDRCVTICPLNADSLLEDKVLAGISAACYPLLPGLEPRDEIISLDKDTIRALSEQDFAKLFRHSPIKRIKLSGLLRNIQ